MKKSAWEKSEFGKIKAVNIFNAFYHGVIAAGTMFFAEPTTSIKALGILFASTAFFSIFKALGTNSKGEMLKGEQ